MALPTPTQATPESSYRPPGLATTSPEGQTPAAWHPATLAAFRFGVVYFGLYVVTTQMLGALLPIPGFGFPRLQVLPPLRDLVLWVGRHVFGIASPIAFRLTGSGDRTFDWLHGFTLLSIAVVSTVVWTSVARDEHQAKLFARFRLFLRLAMGATMLSYGMVKVIPLQMPIGTLTRLVEPFGNFSPMGVLWFSIGASPGYEIFTGLAEVCGGLLLLIPFTAPLGALMCMMNTIAVFMLNMTYDVPVKLFSFHLVAMSAFLAAPNAPRLFDFFIRRRNSQVRAEPVLGNTPSARRKFFVAQVIYAGWVLLWLTVNGASSWKRYGDGAPKSPFYGIWTVDEMTLDGQSRPALVTDTTRWRRLVFQRATSASFQRMNDSFVSYGSVIDTAKKTLTLTAFDSAKTVSPLTYQRPTRDRLLLDGTLDGHPIHLELSYRNPDSYIQRSRGFHWISEVPFNR